MAYKKYRNQIVEIDGIRFASKLEARRYQELKLLERAGEIRDLITQPKYVLQERTTDPNTGQSIPRQMYYGDFQYWDAKLGKLVCEDTKGIETQTFRLKWNLVRPRYPHVLFKVLRKGDICD